MAITAVLPAQSVIYVKKGGQGNGQSWQSALGDLRQALQMAQNGQQIWVAQGEYFPTSGFDRSASFVIPNGVALYGGFTGTEKTLEERPINPHSTVLSGNIGSPGSKDNSFSVIRTSGVSPQTIVDGFLITGGNADLEVTIGNPKGCGGGWYNDGANGKTSSPTIRNCIFVDNQAHFGGGLFNNGSEGECRVTIEQCSFSENIAFSNGGAIYNSGINGSCNILIASTEFYKNQASYGAGIQNRADSGVASPMIRSCTFRENVAYLSGSGVYNYRSPEGTCRPVLTGCIFENNKDGLGETVSKPFGPKVISKDNRTSSIIMRPTY